MIILAELNVNSTIICCCSLITLMNEAGPQTCEEYSQKSTVTLTTEGKYSLY